MREKNILTESVCIYVHAHRTQATNNRQNLLSSQRVPRILVGRNRCNRWCRRSRHHRSDTGCWRTRWCLSTQTHEKIGLFRALVVLTCNHQSLGTTKDTPIETTRFMLDLPPMQPDRKWSRSKHTSVPLKIPTTHSMKL